MMTRLYKVAGHVFSLTLPASEKLWGALTQYQPFEVQTDEQPLFSLELVETMEPCEAQKVYDAPTEDGQTVIKLYRTGEDWIFEMSPDHKIPTKARMRTDKDFRDAKLFIETRKVSDAVFAVNNSLMLLYAFCTASLGTLEMHASVIGNSGKAYLFLGKSGTGKSTHSSLWLKYVEGSELMNDDNPIVRVWPDGRVIAYGSPWSGKTPCYRNVEAPVGAFVRIRQHPENIIAQMGIVEAYATLYSSCSGFKAKKSIADGLHATLESVVTNVPCYVLDCRPDEEAARVCSETVR